MRKKTANGSRRVRRPANRSSVPALDGFDRKILQALVDDAAVAPPPRIATRPTKGSKRRRVETKVRRGQVKAARARIVDDAS